ncbi:MAG TPA: hypothetical protein VHK06_07780 [Candidatus Limnocylindria bacterium]|nr:hypothetical protein [Candidatus Limnocylindria bacterium]
MKSRLAEVGEVLIGTLWWGSAYAWGALVGSMILLAPLLMANLVAEVFDGVSATVALGVGVAAAYVLGFWPWNAESRPTLLATLGGAAASVLGWQILRGSADGGTVLVAMTVATLGWPVRRLVSRIRPTGART